MRCMQISESIKLMVDECKISVLLKRNCQTNSYFEITTFFNSLKENRRVARHIKLYTCKKILALWIENVTLSVWHS